MSPMSHSDTFVQPMLACFATRKQTEAPPSSTPLKEFIGSVADISSYSFLFPFESFLSSSIPLYR